MDLSRLNEIRQLRCHNEGDNNDHLHANLSYPVVGHDRYRSFSHDAQPCHQHQARTRILVETHALRTPDGISPLSSQIIRAWRTDQHHHLLDPKFHSHRIQALTPICA